MRLFSIFVVIVLLFSCGNNNFKEQTSHKQINKKTTLSSVFLIILGTIQDAGSPHIGCKKDCCKDLFGQANSERMVSSLGLVDNNAGRKYLFEASPNITQQLKLLITDEIKNRNELVDGIFLTHAHIGHYSGLMYLGKEAIDTKNMNVYAMPRMKQFLENNGPWSQLTSNSNIILHQVQNEKELELGSNIIVTPYLVPHRDEFSETVGYKIKGPNKIALFIPDINKWELWSKSIVDEIKNVDYAFIDGTFFSGDEIDTRDISLIPHPFISESMVKFKQLDLKDKNKIIFIHFNHTNPVLKLNSKESKAVINQGFRIARVNDIYNL